LFEYEQKTGKPRFEYGQQEGFQFKEVLDAASGKDVESNLASEKIELRYWALVKLIQDSELPAMSVRKSASSMMRNDPSMAVRLKAIEFWLSKNQGNKKLDKEVIDQLMKLADKRNSNYYVACNALDLLDRYSDLLDDESISKIRALDTDASEIPRGNDNMVKLGDRFARPRVLILGDSISIGYTPFVKTMLADEADVFRPMKGAKPANCGGTDRGIKQIDRWLKIDGGNWDLIHVNFGLHDLKHVNPKTGGNSDKPNDPPQSNPQDYEKQLRVILKKVKATKAKVIVCLTTPVPPDCKPFRATTSPAVYNEIAERIAEEHGFAVNDLFTFADSRLKEIQLPANVHFSKTGSKALAEEVAKAIRKQIGK